MHPNRNMGEVVLGISGASGAIYGVRLAQVLNELGIDIRQRFWTHYTEA